jgi:hypothetical protein
MIWPLLKFFSTSSYFEDEVMVAMVCGGHVIVSYIWYVVAVLSL